MKIEAIAENNYQRFCHMEGSQYIASEFALITVLSLIKFFKINTVLEVGIGIGSIADTVQRFSKREQKSIVYFGTEANEFCRKVLLKNIEDFSRVNLFSDLSMLPLNRKFELVIIDGQDNKLDDIKCFCEAGAIIYIEGDRTVQRDLISKVFPAALQVDVISLRRNKSYAHGECRPSDYVGGGQVIFTKPTGKMRLYWAFHKMRTQIIWRIRTFFRTSELC